MCNVPRQMSCACCRGLPSSPEDFHPFRGGRNPEAPAGFSCRGARRQGSQPPPTTNPPAHEMDRHAVVRRRPPPVHAQHAARHVVGRCPVRNTAYAGKGPKCWGGCHAFAVVPCHATQMAEVQLPTYQVCLPVTGYTSVHATT